MQSTFCISIIFCCDNIVLQGLQLVLPSYAAVFLPECTNKTILLTRTSVYQLTYSGSKSHLLLETQLSYMSTWQQREIYLY